MSNDLKDTIMTGNSLKILTIGVYGIPDGTGGDLVSANVFQDYDALIVDPSSLYKLYDSSNIKFYDRDKMRLDYENGQLLAYQSSVRKEQISGLLKKGGVVVVLMAPPMVYKYGDSDRLTNYDWLLDQYDLTNELNISYGKGTTIDFLKTTHPFYDYLKTKPSWSAYADIERLTIYDWQVIASAYGTHALSVTKQVENGHIVFIPDHYNNENGDILEECILSLIGNETPIAKPEWIVSIIVPGQEILIPQLETTSQAIKKLQTEANKITQELEDLDKWKYLLYESGEKFLRTSVRNALSLIGFQNKSDTEVIADGFFSCIAGNAILEVEGSKDSIKIEKISQLIKDRANYIEEKKTTSPKGILVGNPFRDQPLDNRPPKDTKKSFFTKELLQTAEKQDVVVLLSSDLFEVVSSILKGDISDNQKEEIVRKIYGSVGLLRLP